MTTSANPPYKQLRRTTDDKIIAGVCGGLGRYFGVDPVLMRVIFAVTVVLTGGLALFAYPVLWFLMPEDHPAGMAPMAGPWQGGGASATWQSATHGSGNYQPPTYQPPSNPDPAPYQAPADHAPYDTPSEQPPGAEGDSTPPRS